MVRFLELPQWLKTPGQKFANELPGPVTRQDFIPTEDACTRRAVLCKPLVSGSTGRVTRSQCVLSGFVKETRYSDSIPENLMDQGFPSGGL